MSIGKKVAWNTIVQFVGKLVSVAIAVVTLGLIMRYLGAEHFGWYTTVVSFLQVFGIIADFGLVIITAQMLTEFREERVWGNLLGFRVVSALVIIGLAPALVWFFPYPHAVKVGVMISSAGFLAIALQQIATGLFQRHLAMHFNVLGELLARVTILLGMLFVISHALGFFAVLAVVVISNLVQLAVFFTAAGRFTPVRIYFDGRVWREITHRVAPITLGLLFNVVYLRGDVLVLTLLRPQTEIGLYGAAYRVLDIITQVPIMYMGVVLPLITAAWISHDRTRIEHLIERSAHFFILIATPLIVGGMLLATRIMVLVGGPQFAPAGPIASVLFLALAGGFAGALYGHTIVAINKQRQSLFVYATVAALGIIGYVITIPRFGVWGAAWVSVGTETVAGIMLCLLVKKITGVHTRVGLFFMKVAIATALMALAVWYSRALPLGVVIAIGMVMYALAVIVLRAVTKKDLLMLMK